MALIAASALAVLPACASAASPVLEFMTPGSVFPVGFTADGGEVTAEMAGFDTVVHCTGSNGEGKITGPQSTVSIYAFTGCVTLGGTKGGQKCKSAGANEEEIATGLIDADLVYINQAMHEVGMLLDPLGGTYMSFECGGESVEARGPFLSPVGPINTAATSFTASLSRLGATQVPSEYENANGERLHAIPTGKKGSDPFEPTGVGLSFAIHPSASLQIRAITAAEIEAKQREEAAARKRHEDEVAAKKHWEEEQARLKALARGRHLSKGLNHCRKASSKHKRMRCEKRVKKKYGVSAAR
ncbi:MAG TPA: hypothetical protein VLL27_02570 [Solirubrobacterales bacterium]|nr:hypothetical protein [Solirubrobacterales bacterium]